MIGGNVTEFEKLAAEQEWRHYKEEVVQLKKKVEELEAEISTLKAMGK